MHAGYTINQYKIIDRIGEGGMGVVYLAEDTRLYRKVALKFVSNSSLDSTEEIARFQREARAAARLNHPNICTVHELGETEDKTYIAMEYVEGVTLKERIGQGNITEEDIRKWLLQIAEGLHVAHEAGVIHRDIKPANIMMTDAGLIKIMDFGIAKLMESDTELTRANSTIGTIAYMSPEQARGETINRQTDIWSVGVILYELTTGKRPFEGAFREAVMYAMMHDDPKPPSSINPDVAPELEVIITQCLQRDRLTRYESLDILLSDLGVSSPSSNAGLISEQEKINEESAGTEVHPLSSVRKGIKGAGKKSLVYGVAATLVLIGIGWGITWFTNNQAKVRWAREEALPRIETLTENIPWTGEGPYAAEAYKLIKQAEQIIPDDLLLANLTSEATRQRDILSNPPGAEVYIKPYADVDSAWQYLGKSPMEQAHLPRGFSRIKLEKVGFETVEDVVWVNDYNRDSQKAPARPIQYWLPEAGSLPEGMVFLPDSTDWYGLYPAPYPVHLLGLKGVPEEPIGDFFMDRHEVTNRAYKRFVDEGGYTDPSYWEYPFINDGVTLSFEEAMMLFRDKTNRPGPATWEVGDYPDGEDDYPVTGVSWYEAAAYAAYMGKKLPTIYHWERTAFVYASPEIIPLSNLADGKGPVPVVQSQSMNRLGVTDLSGNVREWVFNESSLGGRFLMGGAWNDHNYKFMIPNNDNPFDRSEANGFRCIKYAGSEQNQQSLQKAIPVAFRDFYAEEPVSDEVFAIYLNQFAYDKAELDVVEEAREETEDWVMEKVSFTAAYGNERMSAFLFLPKRGTPPYQTVIHFPGGEALSTRTSDMLVNNMRVSNAEMFLKSGRALLYPIYKNTYERIDKNQIKTLRPNDTSVEVKELMIKWVKDVSRSIDYLETRDDLDVDRLAYFGFSLGSKMGAISLAVEPRIKAAVLNLAGLTFARTMQEVELINYLPRVQTPVRLINGRHDFFIPYETSQLPFFELLGTPGEDKDLYVHESGHVVPRDVLKLKTLDWFDKYQGPVE